MGDGFSMDEVSSESGIEESAFLVRQPVFTRDKDIWGYELVASTVPVMQDGKLASSFAELVSVYQSNLSTLDGGFVDGKKILMDIFKETQLSCCQLPEKCDQCIVGLSQDIAASSACPLFVDSLREGGVGVALDEGIETDIFKNFADKCDVVKVSLADKTPQEIVKIRQKYKGYDFELLATDVTSWEAYEGTRALGFTYFQGPFFSIPQIEKGKEISASAVSKLQLLRELGNPNCEMEELATIIASDVSLSYRILKYINSASFGLKNKIKSIQQAVSLLGLNEVRHWATVVVMTDLDSTPKGEELAFMALQRGRFLSRLVEGMKDFKYSPNTMFMLGLFSKLDALLSYPMDEALKDIPLDQEIKEGLCGTLNEFRDWLRMLEAIEIGNWAIANDILSRHGACFTDAATQYMKAASWAAHQLPDMKNSKIFRRIEKAGL